MEMKFKAKNVIGIVVLVVIVVLAGWYVGKNWDAFAGLRIVSPWMIAVLVVLFVINIFFTGLVNNELMKAFGLKLGQGESFALACVTGFYNLVTPFRGGMAARAVYLKKKHKFDYVNFLATMSAIYVLIFGIAGLIGVITSLWIWKTSGMISWVIFGIFNIVFIGCLGIVVVSPEFRERKGRLWVNRVIKVINGWSKIRKNKRVIFVTGVITLIQVLIGSFMLWLSFRVFGIDVGFMSCLFLNAIGSLSLVIAVTPGNLGVSEAVTVFSAATVGIGTAESFSVAVLGRLVGVVVLFVLGPICSYLLLKKK